VVTAGCVLVYSSVQQYLTEPCAVTFLIELLIDRRPTLKKHRIVWSNHFTIIRVLSRQQTAVNVSVEG
jgi:hypothetical protein